MRTSGISLLSAAVLLTILLANSWVTTGRLTTVPLNITLFESIKGIPGISHYFEHCEAAGLQNLLNGGSKGHTMIASTNEGFEEEAESLKSLGHWDRRQYIRNTIIEGEYTAQSLTYFAAENGDLSTMAQYPIVCHAYYGGDVYTINGGRVIKQYITLDGVLIIVDKLYHQYNEPLLVSLHVNLPNVEHADILEETIDKLKRNGYKFDDCTFTTPPEAVIEHLKLRPELLLHYVFIKRYYPIDHKYLESITSYAGIVYNVDYNCNNNVRIGNHAVYDLSTCRISNEGVVVYPAKKGQHQVDIEALGLNLDDRLAILNR